MSEIGMPSANADDEIDLFDLLLVLLEHWKWLVFGPLLIAALVYGGASMWPKTYESSAVIAAHIDRDTQPPQRKQGMNAHEMAAVLASRALLEDVTQKLGLPADADALQRLQSRIHVNKDRSNAYVTLTATARTPEEAQRLAQGVLDALQERSRPAGAELQRLQAEMVGEQARLQAASQLEEALVGKMMAQAGNVSEPLTRAYAELVRSNAEKKVEINTLQARLDGISAANVLSAPYLPNKPSSPGRWKATILAGLISGVLLGFFVLARHAWRTAASHPANADKVRRMRAVFGR